MGRIYLMITLPVGEGVGDRVQDATHELLTGTRDYSEM